MARDRTRDDAPTTETRVGYGCPPKEHRFKKGQTSNPWGCKGKPKPKIDFLDEEVVLRIAGKPRRLKRWEILDRALFQHGTSGNVSAAKLLLENHRRRLQEDRHEDRVEAVLSPEDQAALEHMIERRARARRRSTIAETESTPSDAETLGEDKA